MCTPNLGLRVNIYHGPIDCTLGGISSQVNEAVIVGDNMPALAPIHSKRPGLHMVKLFYHGMEYRHLEPIDGPGIGWSFGGNFAWTSDSRFPNQYPLPIHDRRE